jgi:hypothetical protein
MTVYISSGRPYGRFYLTGDHRNKLYTHLNS